MPEHFFRNQKMAASMGMAFPEQSRRGRQYQRFEEWHYNDAYDVLGKYYQLIYAVDVAIGMIRRLLKLLTKHKL